MKKNMLKMVVMGILALIIASLPCTALAQGKGKGKAQQSEGTKAEKKKGVPPLVGKVAAIDKTAKTITIGNSTVQITSETRFEKQGKPATLDDGVVGEWAMVRYNKTEDGKMVALMVRFGPRPEGESGEKKKKGND